LPAVFDGEVGVDEFSIGIAENGTIRGEVEKHRTAAQKGLYVLARKRGENVGMALYEPTLSPRPI